MNARDFNKTEDDQENVGSRWNVRQILENMNWCSFMFGVVLGGLAVFVLTLAVMLIIMPYLKKTDISLVTGCESDMDLWTSYGEWNWSDCSATCGLGTQRGQRSRKCVSSNYCIGNETEIMERPCILQPCKGLAIASTCPPGWDHYKSSCYLFSKDMKSWTDASSVCESVSSSLVAIESQEEENFIAQRLRHEFASFMFWLGGTDQWGNSTSWYWVMTEQLINDGYTDWHRTEPDHPGKQHCLAMRKDFQYKWTDDYCHEDHGYICELLLGSGQGIIG